MREEKGDKSEQVAPLSVEKLKLCGGGIQSREKGAFEMTANPGYDGTETGLATSNVQTFSGRDGRSRLPAALDKLARSVLSYARRGVP